MPMRPSSAPAAAAPRSSTCCRPRTTATASTGRAACWCTATTAATSSIVPAMPASTTPSCGPRHAASAATGARCCSLLDDDPLPRPRLAAAVLAVQDQPEPVHAGPDALGQVHPGVEADPRMRFVGGDLPVLGDIGARAAVVGFRDHL